jgi:hypothetical protein
MLLGVLVAVGRNPDSVTVAPTKNGCTACAVYVRVAVPPLTVNPVATIEAVDAVLVCPVLAL